MNQLQMKPLTQATFKKGMFNSKLKFCTALIILFAVKGNAQVVKILDSITKTPINNFNISNNDYLLSSSTNGTLTFKKENNGKEIKISHIGYLPKTFLVPTKDTTILLSESIIRLGEVVIRNTSLQNFVIGNYQKKTNNVFVNSRADKDINFTVVNKFNSKNEHVEALLFYIAKDENYIKSKDIGSIEAVFFKESSNKLPSKEPFHKISISNYSIGWNKIIIPDLVQLNQVIYYGIRWVFNPEKYHYKNIKNKKIYTFFGPKLGVVSNENSGFHQTLFFNTEKGWRPSSSSPAMLALAISK